MAGSTLAVMARSSSQGGLGETSGDGESSGGVSGDHGRALLPAGGRAGAGVRGADAVRMAKASGAFGGAWMGRRMEEMTCRPADLALAGHLLAGMMAIAHYQRASAVAMRRCWWGQPLV
ncbi:MAG: hypothetical protein H6705_06785 [Myxococcales bacterium]|nr:hypothetical protein [Myxococcales bacterium]